MVTVRVADEDQICPGKTLVGGRAVRRIVVDHFSIPTHHERSMADRMNHDVTIAGGEVIAGERVRHVQLLAPVKSLGEKWRGRIEMLNYACAQERRQRPPVRKIS